MRKKIKWIVLGLLLAGLGIVGYLGATFAPPEFAGMDDIAIGRMEGKELGATIKARIYNPNFYALGARELDYIVSYRDTVIGKGKLPDGMSLAGGDTSALELPMTLDMNGVWAVHKSMLARDKCKLNVHIDGKFTFLKIAYGLDVEAEVEPGGFIKDILGESLGDDGVRMEELKWNSTNLKASEFSFVSVIENPLDVDLTLEQLGISLFVPDSKLAAGKWSLAKPVALKPKYSTRVPGAITLNHLATGAGVATGALKGELRWQASGKMVISLANLPFEVPVEGDVVVHPLSGKVEWEPRASD